MATSPIDPKRLYSARELIELGVLDVKDVKTATRRILDDKLSKKSILKAEIRGDGKMRRYYIKGSCALAYLKANTK